MFRRYAVTNTRFIALVGLALPSRVMAPSHIEHREKSHDSQPCPPSVDSRGVTSLIDFALESLPAMRLDDGAFCFERRAGEARAARPLRLDTR